MRFVFVLLLFFITPVHALDVDKLLKLAEKWEVPQPHADSKIVKIWAFSSGTNQMEDFYLIGFVEPQDDKRALVGFTYQSLERSQESKPFTGSLKNITGSNTFGGMNGLQEGLIAGIQLIRHGKRDIGEELIKKSLKEDAGHGHSPLHIAANLPAEEALARSCLAAALNEIVTEKPNFKAIKRKVETLLEDEKKIKHESVAYFLEALTATVNHPKPKQGSMEEVIDLYLMSGGRQGIMSGREANAAKQVLILKGFAAIPTLIKHLDDKRMTNHLMQGFNNFVSHPMTANRVINNYLHSFANNEMGSNWLERQKGVLSEQEKVQKWWEEASAMGEKKYVEKYTLVKSKKGLDLSSELLAIAVDRYPEMIPVFYARAIKSKMHSWPVAEVFVAHPKIPLETKMDLLLKAVATGKEEHRNSALRGLVSLKSEKANVLLLKLIKEAPKTTQTEYWTDQNPYLARMVSQTDNVELWKAIIAYIKRADLGMRMELIHHLSPKKDAPKEILNLFFQVYDLYKDDLTVRDEKSSKKFDGPGAGFPYTKIAVRDFIHTHYASWMGLKLEWPDRNEPLKKQWVDYRKKVSEKVMESRQKHELR